MRTFLARIIEGDPRRGARVDLSIDLRPKALSLNGSPPEFIVTHTNRSYNGTPKVREGGKPRKTAGVT